MYRRLDYRCEGREKVGALSGQVMPLDRSWLPRLENPIIPTKKRAVQPGDAFEGTACKPGFEVVKF
jgi:hypothetical protein